jgi:hypothetical protein
MDDKSTDCNENKKTTELQGKEKTFLPVNDQKIQSIAQKLKENTTSFFKQFKIGCFREFCYNPFCAKSQCKSF